MIEQTGEYMFYNVSFKSTPSGIMDTIELSTQVRRSVSHDIVITNPLNSQVTFSASTTIPEISLPSNFVVGPDSKVCVLTQCTLHISKALWTTIMYVHDITVCTEIFTLRYRGRLSICHFVLERQWAS